MTTGELQAGPLPQAADDDEHHPGPLKRASNLQRATQSWSAWRARRREARAAAAAAGPIEPGPLPQAAASDEHHAGPLPQTAHPQRVRKTWREKRWERRRKRRFTEEVLGWILVPIIVVAGFWAAKAGLNALGTSPTALVQGIRAAVSASGKF